GAGRGRVLLLRGRDRTAEAVRQESARLLRDRVPGMVPAGLPGAAGPASRPVPRRVDGVARRVLREVLAGTVVAGGGPAARGPGARRRLRRGLPGLRGRLRGDRPGAGAGPEHGGTRRAHGRPDPPDQRLRQARRPRLLGLPAERARTAAPPRLP